MRATPHAAIGLLTLLFTGAAAAQVGPSGYWDAAPLRTAPSYPSGYAGYQTPSYGYAPSYGSAPSYGYAPSPAAASYFAAAQPSASVLPSTAPVPAAPRSSACTSPSYAVPAASHTHAPAANFGQACNSCMYGNSQWNVTLDALVMTRLPGHSYPFLRVQPTYFGSPTVQDTADLDYNWQFGSRLATTYLTDSGCGFEVGFLGISHGWQYYTDGGGPY